MRAFIYNLKEEFHKNRNFVFVVFVFCMAMVCSFFATSSMNTSSAANLANFQAGNIISDAVMSNYNAMSVTEIQQFLDSKNKCDNRDYNLYLQYTRNQPSITWHWDGEPYNGHFVCLAQERFGDGEIIGQGMTAAEIIADAAKQNRINPQVLLVLLQKETGLITDKVPNNYDYRKATGYGCPDTAACDSKYYGFKNQVYRAAELFRYVLDNDSRYYPSKHTVYVGYHPTTSCGGTQVYIENRATAALYQYTPYQPNAAALNAGYGTGDACSAYGNRNFYQYFTDWFGSTQISVDGELTIIPDGEYSLVSAVSSARVMALDGSNVELGELDDEDTAQRWSLRRDKTTGYYEIINLATNLPLVPQSSDIAMNTNVVAAASATCAKWWKLYLTSDNYLTFESTCTNGMVLDVRGGANAVGTNIEMYPADNTKAQKWQIRTGQTLADGVYTIHASGNEQQVIDIAGGLYRDGDNIDIWTAHGGLNQLWKVIYNDETDDYQIVNPYSGKSLDLNSAKAVSGQNIQLWLSNSSCAQRWKLVADGEYYRLLSTCSYSYALDLSNNETIPGRNIQLWKTNDGNAQKWSFVQQEPILKDGTYVITSKLSEDLALDIADNSTKSGANVLVWSKHGGVNQQWEVHYNEKTNDYTIYNPNSGKNLDLNTGIAQDGQNIQIWSTNSSCAQRWKINQQGEYYEISSACNDTQVIDIYGGINKKGQNVIVWKRNNGNNQKWQFVPIS